MQLAKIRLPSGTATVGVVRGQSVVPFADPHGTPTTVAEILDDPDPGRRVAELIGSGSPTIALADAKLLPPIDRQEVWAAGVTYKRSKTARMEESTSAASLY